MKIADINNALLQPLNSRHIVDSIIGGNFYGTR